ncbi:MAG TPA: DUF3127 domain-containing protein [Williamwhitmania sp.]|nr:DUF3127 domain-containing protein [Williamwhitmania sp.]
MALEIQGKLVQMLEKQVGTGRNGTWEKQEFILETTEQYPKKICISAWGDKIKDIDSAKPGDMLKVSFNLESREFNGRWYTDIRAWRISREGAGAGAGAAASSSTGAPMSAPPSFDEMPPIGGEEEINDLPF